MRYDTLINGVEKLKQAAPRGEIVTFGGVEMERFNILAGTVLVSHCHVYDHPSILAAGTVELWTPDKLTRLEGPIEVEIGAGVKHAIYALTDAVWYCIRPEGVEDE